MKRPNGYCSQHQCSRDYILQFSVHGGVRQSSVHNTNFDLFLLTKFDMLSEFVILEVAISNV